MAGNHGVELYLAVPVRGIENFLIKNAAGFHLAKSQGIRNRFSIS